MAVTRDVPVPVDAGRFGRKRAWVLLFIHVAIALHIAHWSLSGRTLAPLELNEVVYTLELGIVTAGFLFMVLAVVSTLAFGRFFCSWGCHILALQDGAAWLLRKAGFKPRLVRSRLLAITPFVVMAYMFVWPQVVRIAEGRGFPTFRVAGDAEGWASFITTSFWRNLPGIGITLLTFLTCGFLMVFVLGTRAFCRYACPYGAVFAIADRFAPVRIKATSPCANCGVCTSVCDSHVRVHEEIGRHGMIVDPNCLRDLDCVAVCPNGTLTVGRSRPSLFKRVVGDVKVKHLYDLSIAEEGVAAMIVVGTILSLRGLYDTVPFFVSIAIGTIAAAIVVTTLRLARGRNATFLKAPLRANGRLTRQGIAFLAGAAIVYAFLGHSVWIRWNAWSGLRAHAANDDDVALARLERVNEHGLFRTPIAIDATTDILRRKARAAFEGGDVRGAIAKLARAAHLLPHDAQARCDVGAMLLQAGEPMAALARLREAVERDPAHAGSVHNLAIALAQTGALEEALATAERACALDPKDEASAGLRDELRRALRR